MSDIFIASFGAILGAVTALWLLSLYLRDVSIVDLYWGPGFALVAWTAYVTGEPGARGLLSAVLVTVWGLRLGLYLFNRNHGKPEDYRYAAMRRHWGPRFAFVSFATVFLLQAVVQWTVSVPVQAVQMSPGAPLGVLDYVGCAVFAVGLFFEAVGDYQLSAFKADPSNEGRVMDRGLWAWTRHPNYFGDFTVWWGLGLIAVAGGAWWALVGPAVMSVFLMRISGAALLEKGLRKSKPKYAEYEARTSAFFPWPPKGARAD